VGMSAAAAEAQAATGISWHCKYVLGCV
jgi:hypothetical protein